jgi:hypothetical protein
VATAGKIDAVMIDDYHPHPMTTRLIIPLAELGAPGIIKSHQQNFANGSRTLPVTAFR